MATVTTLAYKDVKSVMTKSSLSVEDFPSILMWAVRTHADTVMPLL